MPATRSLKARALQWLAQREQSRVELRRKLLPHALAEDAARADADANTAAAVHPVSGDAVAASAIERVDALLDWLEANRYLSAERFAESRVHARAPRFGNLRIRHELKQHQAPLSSEALRVLNESETQRACEVRERKFGPPASAPQERARQARFLAGRGFSPEAIGRALRHAGPLRDPGEPPDFDA